MIKSLHTKGNIVLQLKLWMQSEVCRTPKWQIVPTRNSLFVGSKSLPKAQVLSGEVVGGGGGAREMMEKTHMQRSIENSIASNDRVIAIGSYKPQTSHCFSIGL